MSERPLEIRDGGNLNCPTCGQGLSWEQPGVYSCDICTAAHAHGQSIEEVRRDVEQLAHSWAHKMSDDGGATVLKDGEPIGLVELEPERHAPTFNWSPIDEESRAWELEHAAAASAPQGADSKP